VLHELRTADVASLTAAQSAARGDLISRLEHYAAASRFPHNHVRPGAYVPVFRDEHGTLCAMAYLIASTGRTDIVDHVASTNNLAFIPELAQSAVLRAWLDSAGLTVAEAARIQPSYDGGWIPAPDETPSKLRGQRRDYALASSAVTPFSSASAFFNLAARRSTPSRIAIWGGVLTGVAQVAYGVSGLDDADQRRTMGVANIGVGSTAVASSIWRMRRPASAAASRTASVSVQPLVTSHGTGLMINARM